MLLFIILERGCVFIMIWERDFKMVRGRKSRGEKEGRWEGILCMYVDTRVEI